MQPRLNRLFAPDGRCLDVAVDHGFFGEPSFLAGIEDMASAVVALAEAGPDAIQLSRGQALLLQRIPGPAKPALVLRTDVANVYGREGKACKRCGAVIRRDKFMNRSSFYCPRCQPRPRS